MQQVQHLRLDRDELVTCAQLLAVNIQTIVLENVDQVRLPAARIARQTAKIREKSGSRQARVKDRAARVCASIPSDEGSMRAAVVEEEFSVSEREKQLALYRLDPANALLEGWFFGTQWSVVASTPTSIRSLRLTRIKHGDSCRFRHHAPRAPPPRRLRLLEDERWLAFVLLVPTMVLLGMFIAYPFVRGITLSVTNSRVGVAGDFVGLANYYKIWNDFIFRTAVYNTFLYTAVTTFFKLSLGLWLAMCSTATSRARHSRALSSCFRSSSQRCCQPSLGSGCSTQR